MATLNVEEAKTSEGTPVDDAVREMGSGEMAVDNGRPWSRWELGAYGVLLLVALVMRVWDLGDQAIRLLGIGMNGLRGADAPRQLAVDRGARWDDLADAVHDVRSRFGHDAVEPARLRQAPSAPKTGNENPYDAYTEREQSAPER